MDRRHFLTRGLALGCSAAASPLLTPVAFASGPWDTRLVVIILRGAMDGLDVVRPVGDVDYAALRPTLSDGAGSFDTGFFRFHPALAPLEALWREGSFGAVHAVSTPYRDQRSHFDGQDILEAGGTESDSRRDGWLNRMLQVVPGVTAETAYAIGLVVHDDPLFREAAAQAFEISDDIAADADAIEALAEGMANDPMMAQVGRGGHVRLAEFAVSRLRGESRIASFSIGGWDTHQDQARNLPRALSAISDTLLTLRSGLGPVWEKTAVLCMTEFGRTARENGTRGTDHGTGGALLYAGGALRGGQVSRAAFSRVSRCPRHWELCAAFRR